MSRKDVENLIERKLKKLKGVKKFYIEKKDKESIDVVVQVSEKINKTETTEILNLENIINRKYKIPSDFKLCSTGSI